MPDGEKKVSADLERRPRASREQIHDGLRLLELPDRRDVEPDEGPVSLERRGFLLPAIPEPFAPPEPLGDLRVERRGGAGRESRGGKKGVVCGESDSHE